MTNPEFLIFEKNCTSRVTLIVPNYLTLESTRKTKTFSKVQWFTRAEFYAFSFYMIRQTFGTQSPAYMTYV